MDGVARAVLNLSGYVLGLGRAQFASEYGLQIWTGVGETGCACCLIQLISTWTRCRIPELVRYTPLPPPLVLHDAPLRVLYHHSPEYWAHPAVDPLSMTIPCATPSLQYDTTAHVFASNVRYSVHCCLRLDTVPLAKVS